MAICIIKVCRNYKGRLRTSIQVTYHRIPNDPLLRSRWVKIIRKSRGEDFWQPGKSTVICSDHFRAEDLYFVGNQKRRRLKKEAIPCKALFLSSLESDDDDLLEETGNLCDCVTNVLDDPEQSVAKAKQPASLNYNAMGNIPSSSHHVPLPLHDTTNEMENVPPCKKTLLLDILDTPLQIEKKSTRNQKIVSSEQLEDANTEDLDYNLDLSPPPIDPVQNTETTEQNLEDRSLVHSVKDNEQSQERRALNAQALKVTLARIQDNPQLYVGIPKNCYHIVDLLHKQTKIPTTHILLCLKKVKLDTHFEELADQFGIPSKEAKGLFVENIPVIAKTLQSFIANLDSNSIKSNLLIPFRRHQNTTTVIDTLELKVQPTTDQSKELTQSENGNTIKYLISCCPDGFVDYVSPGYGGRQTDENLLESTGYLERFEPGTCIITKRLRNAEPMLLRKGMKLVRPRSYTKQSSPRADQYAPYKRVLDNHIERIVQRVREFTMIKDNTAISSDLVRVLDEAVVISCALINLQSFVIN